MKNLKYKLSIGLWISFASLVVIYLITRFYIQWQSEERYTICEIKSNYFSSKEIGKKYEYMIDEILYENICSSQDCTDSKIGGKYLMKYWVDNPKWTEIYFHKPLEKEIEIPKNGWEIPPF